VLASSSAANLAAAAKAIAAEGPEPLTVVADLRELVGCEQVLARAKERFNRCDILINNAGAPVPATSSILRTRLLSTASR
jgi:NAD(P)-dependent dehydrogenase (short-subunit alcohol dehydrogenase family)